MGYVAELLWWPIQSPNKGRKKKAKSQEEREIRSSLLILDLRDSMLRVVRFNSFFVDDFGSFQAMPVGKRNASIEVDEIVVGPRAYCNKFHRFEPCLSSSFDAINLVHLKVFFYFCVLW